MNDQNALIYTNLLSPEDRISRKNLLLWTENLIQEAQHLLAGRIGVKHLAAFATLFNNSALVFLLQGQIKRAEEICYKQIDSLWSYSKEYLPALSYVVQPWINLARLDRSQHNFVNALTKLKKLNFTETIIELEEYAIKKEDMLLALKYQPEVQQVIQYVLCLDTLKTFLAAKDYASVLQYSGEQVVGFEALFIAQMKLDNVDSARKILNAVSSTEDPEFVPMFTYREMELLRVIDLDGAVVIANKLNHYIHYLQTRSIDSYTVFFCVTVAAQLYRFGFEKIAKNAFKVALTLARKVEDELLIVTCLEHLLLLDTDQQYFADLEKIIRKTGYLSLIRKYASHFTLDTYHKEFLTHRLNFLFHLLHLVGQKLC